MKGNYESLVSLAKEIERLETVKHDFITPASNISMIDDEVISIARAGDFKLNDTAHSQIAAKLDIPKKYYDKMSTIPGLRQHNVNNWLQLFDTNKGYLIRTHDETARAFLSDKYRPIDHMLLLSAFLPVMEKMEVKVKSSSLTDSKMYLQLIFPELEGEIEKGDVVQAGITISNSEQMQEHHPDQLDLYSQERLLLFYLIYQLHYGDS